MITLKKAHKYAFELNEAIPSVSTLRDWVNVGAISSAKDYRNDGNQGGRVGMYPDRLPVEIATACELTRTYGWTLKEVAEVRKDLIEEIEMYDDTRNLLEKKIEEHGEKVREFVDNLRADRDEAIKTVAETRSNLALQKNFLKIYFVFEWNYDEVKAV